MQLRIVTYHKRDSNHLLKKKKNPRNGSSFQKPTLGNQSKMTKIEASLEKRK